MRDDFTLPPHSIEAEQSVLGAVLLDNGVLDRINGNLSPDHFYLESHATIFEHERRLHEDGKPVDVTTLHDSLKAAGKVDDIGGMVYLGALVGNVPTAAHAESYARIIRERANLRRIAATANGIAEAARTPGADPAAILGDAAGHFDALATEGAAGRYAFLDDANLRADLFEQRPPPLPFIIEGILPQAPGLLVGAGGIGKTRLLLWESIHLALGRDFLGHKVHEGRVLFVTAEDDRQVFESRLYDLVEAMELTKNQRRVILDRVLILDVTGIDARLVESDMAHNLVQTGIVPALVKRYKGRGVRLVNLDPVSNLGPGEIHGNDGGSRFMVACWALSKGLQCAVRGVHHVAKAVAREGTLDQHAGRGGSSYADNSRHVWQLTDAAGTAKGRPQEADAAIAGGSPVVRIDVHKVSYCRRPRAPYFLTDLGAAFEHIVVSAEAVDTLQRDLNTLCQILTADRLARRKHSRKSLEDLPAERRCGLGRNRVREVIAEGLAGGRLIEEELPESEQVGNRKTCIAVSATYRRDTGDILAPWEAECPR